MMGLRLRLESTARTSIEEAARQMISVANTLGVIVELRANDVELVAYPGHDPAALVAAYHSVALSDSPWKMAFSEAIMSLPNTALNV
jgi:hypothetical protein